MTATATPTVPAWIAPGAPVVVFFGTEGMTMPMAIEQGTIDTFTPFVITLNGGASFDMDTQCEIGEDHPFQTRIVDPASDTTILLMDRFNKKVAMEDFQMRPTQFKHIPSAENAQRIIDSLQGFI